MRLARLLSRSRSEPPASTSKPLTDQSDNNNNNADLDTLDFFDAHSFDETANETLVKGAEGLTSATPSEESQSSLARKFYGILAEVDVRLAASYVSRDDDVKAQLKAAGFDVEKCCAEMLERMGMRKARMNSTLTRLGSFKEDSLDVHDAWSPLDPSVFRVRCGPQYRQTRLKAYHTQGPPLYSVVAVDLFSTEKKVINLCRRLASRDIEGVDEGPLPTYFIVNFLLPLEKPVLGKSEKDGPTLSFHIVMKLSDWTRNNMNHPSVQLLVRFLENCREGEYMRERLKIILQVCNRPELSLSYTVGAMYDRYNGLPFVYRSYNSKYTRGPGWFCANFDGHCSGFAARAGRFGLLGIAHKIVCQCAFLVESETDDEMPERILGCFNVHRLRCLELKKLDLTTPSLTVKEL